MSHLSANQQKIANYLDPNNQSKGAQYRVADIIKHGVSVVTEKADTFAHEMSLAHRMV